MEEMIHAAKTTYYIYRLENKFSNLFIGIKEGMAQ
jgi:hypothetical protein